MKVILKFIPFAVAISLVLAHFFKVLTSPNFINSVGAKVSSTVVDSVFYASLGLGVTLVLVLLKKSYWRYVFLGLILLSFTSFIQFYHRSYEIGIGPIMINVTSLGLLITHLIFNPNMLYLIKPIENRNKAVEVESQLDYQKVNYFKEKFKSKQVNELKQLVESNDLIPEAKEAARLLINSTES